MKKFCSMCLLFLLCCYGCKKENDFDFIDPSIRLLSAEVIADYQGELKVKVGLGAGFKGHKAWLQMTDISEASGRTTIHSIALTEETNQEHTLTIQPPDICHDYQVMAVLETEKNRFETEKQFLFFSKKSHRYDVGHPYIIRAGTYDGAFLDGFVYAIRQPGDVFTINLGNQSYFTVGEMEIVLNETIHIECVYNNNVHNANETVIGRLPADLSPGDYSVKILLDGEAWDVEGLVRVLPWKSEMVDLGKNHPFGYYTISSSFTVGDEIVYVQFLDRNYAEQYSEYKVWSYHIPTQTWKEKKTWIPIEDGSPQMGVGLEDKGYSVLIHNYKACLWSYSLETDEWEQLSYYPGKGLFGFVMFAVDGYIYLGGGVAQKDIQDPQVGVADFWRYNIETQEWEQLAELPFTPLEGKSVNSTCTDGQKAYTFLYDRTLWSYDVANASWTQEETLYQGPYFRYHAPLCMWENKVCLIGGKYDMYNQYTDIQLYDPVTRQWSLKELYQFTPYMSNSYIPAIHQREGSIWVGPLQQWGTYDRPAPHFLKITPQ